jgi:hypothetical protein
MLVIAPGIPGVNKPTRDVAHRDALLARSTLEPLDNVWIELDAHENLFCCSHGGNYKTRLNIGQHQMLIRVSCRWCCGLSGFVKRDAAQDWKSAQPLQGNCRCWFAALSISLCLCICLCL